jgi:hypothetical protein
MGLSVIEKRAGRAFREGAQLALAVAWADFPDSAPCSAQVSFFRHECPVVKGRTRAIRLDDVTLASPEIWVCWNEGGLALEALFPSEAQQRLDSGIVAEYEVILAGKFSFTYKSGKCGHCGMTAMSREGVLKDARPGGKIRQDDLGQSSSLPNDIEMIKREAGLT